MIDKKFTQEQKNKIVEIGASLRRMRLANSISLDTVANSTMISIRLLEAIETGNLAELPEPFYVCALLTKFAKAVNAKEIESEIVALAQLESTTVVTPNKNKKYWLDFQLRSLHLYLIYILLVILSVKGIAVLVERPIIINEIPTEKPILDSELTKADRPPQPVSPAPASQFVSQSSNSQSVTVGINLQERCWLKVMVDGQVAFEGILPQGTKRSWSGKKEVTIRAGNAGGVVISFNNEQQKVLGAPGQVEEITYTVN